MCVPAPPAQRIGYGIAAPPPRADRMRYALHPERDPHMMACPILVMPLYSGRREFARCFRYPAFGRPSAGNSRRKPKIRPGRSAAPDSGEICEQHASTAPGSRARDRKLPHDGPTGPEIVMASRPEVLEPSETRTGASYMIGHDRSLRHRSILSVN